MDFYQGLWRNGKELRLECRHSSRLGSMSFYMKMDYGSDIFSRCSIFFMALMVTRRPSASNLSCSDELDSVKH